jgi:AcrR family transcriptional regulator
VGDARATKGEQTRARLLAAARETFATAGWSKARVEDVCRVAGVGHGTYYAYFANKSAALEALVAQHAADLYALAEAGWDSGDLTADVRRVIAGFVEVSLRDRDVREAWAAAAAADPGLAELVGEVRRQFVSRVRANLVAATEAGRARADVDPDVAAVALAAMVELTVALAPQADPPLSAEQVVDGLTDLWVHAVYRP